MQPLDRIDFEILSELRNNARLSNKELAARIGLAPSSTLVRVRGLERDGVIVGYHADIDSKRLGVGLQAMIAVRLQKHSHDDVESFWSRALAMPEVIHLYHVAGANDFLVHLLVRDADHLRDLAMTAFTTWPEVAHLETGLIFKHERNVTLPFYTAPDDESE